MHVSGIGCGLIDLIYRNVDLVNTKYYKFLTYGGSTDLELFERETGVGVTQAVSEIIPDAKPEINLGGVAVVALVSASQLLYRTGTKVFYYFNVSTDKLGQTMMSQMKGTPLSLEKIRRKSGRGECSYCLCDDQKEGGTRSFINRRTVSDELALLPEDLDDFFFKSDICLFNCIFWEFNVNFLKK
jgi:sugar/nucleoside kinase (ribokinase family)